MHHTRAALTGTYDACMSGGSRACEELQTARLSLRRPTAADIDAIFEIHSDPRTCLHNPSDRLTQPTSLPSAWPSAPA